jgi:glucose/arabinose dehydrogenase/mono/diheme cytochrome c family protein
MIIALPKAANAFVLLAACCLFTHCKERISLPEPDADNGGLYLPVGFDALVVADNTGPARHIAVNDNGDIYVKLTFNDRMNGAGGTVALRDLDSDGRADSVVYFGDYKDEGGSAVGVTIHNGYLYTSTVRTVLRNKLTAGDLIPRSETEIVLTDADPNVVRNWHTTKPLAFDNRGNMFVPFGSPSDGCHDITQFGPVGMPGGSGLNPCPDLEKHGGIWKFPADRIGLTQADGEKYATGLRSIVGMQWNPDDEGLYAVVNGIDNFHTLYPDRFTSWQAAVPPAESLVKVSKGSDFGWPYAYYDQMQGKNFVSPAYGGDGKKTAAQFDTPVMGFPGHWAPMDLLFYRGEQFPTRYRDGVFIAFHGSTDRSPYPQAGYIVCFVPMRNGKATGNWEVFADGFTGVDTVANTSDAVYRPMGLAEGPDGSLYISESNKGRIWRIIFRGDRGDFGEKALSAMENRKSRSYIKTPDEEKDVLNKSSVLEGSILYDTYCASCHQQDGKGDNNRFPPLAGSEWVTGDPERLIRVVLNGLEGKIMVNGKSYNGLMPRHDHLDDHAIASIVSYIRVRFRNKATPVRTSQVSRIRAEGHGGTASTKK